MKSPLKAGFIAAIVGAAVCVFMCWIGYLFLAFGFHESPLGPFWWTITFTIWLIIWGTPWGIIYSWVYDRLPGKGVWKGLLFGIILWLLIDVNYGLVIGFLWPGDLAVGLGTIIGNIYQRIPFGLTIGYLYKKE